MNDIDVINQKLDERIKEHEKNIINANYNLDKLLVTKEKIDNSESFFKNAKNAAIIKTILFSLGTVGLSKTLFIINPQAFASISILMSATCFSIIEALVYINKTKNLKKLVKNTNYEGLCKDINTYKNELIREKNKLNAYINAKKSFDKFILNEEKIIKNQIPCYGNIKQKRK